MTNSPAALWAWLGAGAAGAVYVPLNVHLRGPLLADQIVRAGARVIIADAALVEVVEALGLEVTLISAGDSSAGNGWEAACLADPVDVQMPDSHAVGSILFTSGSTGRSKAALLTHDHFIRAAGACVEAFHLAADDVIHEWLPLYHLGGQVTVFVEAALVGAEVAFFPTFSASRF